MPLEVGAKLGRYRIDALLGKGGMGEVYRAFDARLDREVALKILKRFASESDDDYRERVERFLREARLAAKLKHPNIVTIFDVDEVDGLPLFSMEVLDSRTLRDAIDGAPEPLSVRLEWLRQLADALDASHRAGLVHRDVKPENVMVASGGIKLVDFGIAKPASGDSRNLTLPGYAVGTPGYMAPEHLLGLDVDARADQYAWGIVAYELLRGKHPGTTPLPLDEAGAAPAEIARIVARAMSRDAAQRYASMETLKEALEVAARADEVTREAPVDERVLAEEVAHKEPSTRSKKKKSKRASATRRKKRFAATALAVIGIAAAASTATYFATKRAAQSTTPDAAGAARASGRALQCKLGPIVEILGSHESPNPVAGISRLRVVGDEGVAYVMAQGEVPTHSEGWRLMVARIAAADTPTRVPFSVHRKFMVEDKWLAHYAPAYVPPHPIVGVTVQMEHATRRKTITSLSAGFVESLTSRTSIMTRLPLFDAFVDLAWVPEAVSDAGTDPLGTMRNARVVFAGEAAADLRPGEPTPDAAAPIPSAGGYVAFWGCERDPWVVHESEKPKTIIPVARIAATRTRTGIVFVDDDRLWFANFDAHCVPSNRNATIDTQGVSAPVITAWKQDFIVAWTKRRPNGSYAERYATVSAEGLVSPDGPLVREDLDTPLLRLRSSASLLGAAWVENDQLRLAVSHTGPTTFEPITLLDEMRVYEQDLDLAIAGRVLWVTWRTVYDEAKLARIDCE